LVQVTHLVAAVARLAARLADLLVQVPLVAAHLAAATAAVAAKAPADMMLLAMATLRRQKQLRPTQQRKQQLQAPTYLHPLLLVADMQAHQQVAAWVAEVSVDMTPLAMLMAVQQPQRMPTQ
jgi:hypothetical protein